MRDALTANRENLRACQAAIHLSGDFDPLYVIEAKAAMKAADSALSITPSAALREIQARTLRDAAKLRMNDGEAAAFKHGGVVGFLNERAMQLDEAAKRNGE